MKKRTKKKGIQIVKRETDKKHEQNTEIRRREVERERERESGVMYVDELK